MYAAVEVDPSKDRACKPTDVIASAVTIDITTVVPDYNKADRRAYRITTRDEVPRKATIDVSHELYGLVAHYGEHEQYGVWGCNEILG